MAGKAKFNQEAVFKSIIGPGRELGLESLEQSAKNGKIKIEYSGLTF